jgi:hypothetical protein
MQSTGPEERMLCCDPHHTEVVRTLLSVLLGVLLMLL